MVKRKKRLRRLHHTNSDPPYGGAAFHLPINSKTPRTKARRLVCNGGYCKLVMNGGLRFANPSYELIRLTVFSGKLRVRTSQVDYQQ